MIEVEKLDNHGLRVRVVMLDTKPVSFQHHNPKPVNHLYMLTSHSDKVKSYRIWVMGVGGQNLTF